MFDIANVNIMPISTTTITASVETTDASPLDNSPAKNIIAIVIKNGNLPLHGTNAFVIIDINFSLGESIILQPITPAALQPNPMHIVSACFP